MNITELNIEQVADLINNALKENKGVSVNKICDTLGIKRSTLKSRISRGGYSFNVDKNRYELIITRERLKRNTNKTTEDTAKGSTIKTTDKATEYSTKDKEHNVIDNTTNKTIKHIAEHTTIKTIDGDTEGSTIQTTETKLTIEERVTALERAVKMLEGKGRKSKGITITNTKETTVKSIRIYTEVKKRLDQYIADHKEIKVIDIMSSAIIEYIKKY